MNHKLLALLVAGVAALLCSGIFWDAPATRAGARPGAAPDTQTITDTPGVFLPLVGLGPAGWADTLSTNLPPRFGHASTHVGSYIYTCGGLLGFGEPPLADCWMSTIQTASGHTLTAWQQVTSLPAGRTDAAMAAVGTTLYLIGGADLNGLATTTVYQATVNPADGTLSAWTASSSPLPIALANTGATAVNGHLYVIGGQGNGGTYNANSYVTTPDGSGNLGPWTATTTLIGNYASGVTEHTVLSYSESGTARVYVATGLLANHAYSTDAYSALVNADGTLGAWQAEAPYERPLAYTAGAAYGTPACAGSLFIVGGVGTQGNIDYVGSAFLNPAPDLRISRWYDPVTLVTPRIRHTVVSSDDGWLYVIDGADSQLNAIDNIRYAETACAAGAGPLRAASRTYVSSPFNTGAPHGLLTLSYNTTLTPGVAVNIAFSYRVSNFSDFHDVAFANTATVPSGISTTTTITLPSGTVKQYAQYRAVLSRADTVPDQTPILNWVALGYNTPPTPPPGTSFNVGLRSLTLAPTDTSRPVVNHLLTVNATVVNSGTAAIPAGVPLEVDIYTNLTRPPQLSDPSTTFGRVILSSPLQPGQSMVLQAPWTPTSVGSVTIYAWVNRSQYFPESDYSDNILGPIYFCIFATDGQSFTDVPSTTYFYTPVEYLSCLNIISGYTCGGPNEPCDSQNRPYFRPYNTTTRGQFTKILTNGMAWPLTTPAAGAHTYADVPLTNPFFVFVETAQSHGAIAGYACGGPNEPCDSLHRPYFRPNNYIIRGDIVKYIALAKGWPLLNPATPTFNDVPATDPYFRYVETVSAKGVISGYNCGGAGEPCPGLYFRTASTGTRGQIGKILYLAFTQR
ncbi:MAG TPA: S-layer homology domain-containing protein [Chloroflexia bacterium]|nr:S-layer homology domain-containing protein [Chloroflexia bacterium]